MDSIIRGLDKVTDLRITPGPRSNRQTSGYAPSPKPIPQPGRDVVVKDIGPFFDVSGLAQRVKETGNPFGIPTQYEFMGTYADIVKAYMEELLMYKFTPHLAIGGLTAVGIYWLMYYHPEVLSNLLPDSINAELI